VSEHRVHFMTQALESTLYRPLCREDRFRQGTANKTAVTCRRCLYLLGRYMPTDPERREELIKRQEELTR
jgi:hypothetical protein